MPIDIQDALQRTIEHREIFHDEMLALMRKIMSGEASPVMIAALTVGLRVKKETVGRSRRRRRSCANSQPRSTCLTAITCSTIVGTGGDAAHTFNISTAAMFVAAARRSADREARRALGVVEVGQR